MNEYDEWDPFKSKWKAAFEKGMKVNVVHDENILYLGASSGTTVGHLSGHTEGTIFAVEKSPEMSIPLVSLCETKPNIAPIFADAQNIDYLKTQLHDTKIDILFQDIPSLDQVKILETVSQLVDKKCKIFLSLKTQSISQESPEKTFEKAKKELEKTFKILESKDLEPFHKKHWFLIMQKK